MIEKPPRIRIDHMLEAIAGIEAAYGTSIEMVERDWIRRSAVERGFEIISEASRHLPADLKATEPAIPWRKIAGIGNILRHDYADVSILALYAIFRDDLPPLLAALLRMRARAEP